MCNLNSDLLFIILVNILEVSAQDSALREHLRAVWAGVWLVTGMFSEMNLHVATLGECATTAINLAFEESLMSIGLWVEYSNGLAHILGDSLEALFALDIIVFIITILWLDIVEVDIVFKSNLSSGVVNQVTSWG